MEEKFVEDWTEQKKNLVTGYFIPTEMRDKQAHRINDVKKYYIPTTPDKDF